MRILLALLLTASLHAQTAALSTQTALPNMTLVAPEWINVTLPAGVKLTAQLGCGTWWSAPLTISGAVNNDWYHFGLTAQPPCNGLPSLYVQQGATPVTVTVLNTPSTTMTIPALSATNVTPPPATPTTVTLPINGTCSMSISGNSVMLTIK